MAGLTHQTFFAGKVGARGRRMGCVQSSRRDEAAERVEEPPKAYSW